MASTSTLAAGSNSEISAGASPVTNIASNNKDYSEYIPLHRAIIRCDWDEAQKIISKDKDALTVELDIYGRKALHIAIAVAVGTRKSNDFIQNLLNIMDSESLPTLVTNFKYNPLHHAASVGNINAAKMLVDRNPNLLFILDSDKSLPIHRAVYSAQKDTYLYLLDACKQHILLSKKDGYESPFEDISGAKLLFNAVATGFIDVAYELVQDYPHLARTKSVNSAAPLEAIARKWDAYLSGTDYNFYEGFVYHHVPLKSNLSYSNKTQDVENQETYNDKFAAKCITSSLYTGV